MSDIADLVALEDDCACPMCVMARSFEKHIVTIAEPARSVFKEVYAQLLSVRTDCRFYRGVVEGTWPASEEVLSSYRGGDKMVLH